MNVYAVVRERRFWGPLTGFGVQRRVSGRRPVLEDDRDARALARENPERTLALRDADAIVRHRRSRRRSRCRRGRSRRADPPLVHPPAVSFLTSQSPHPFGKRIMLLGAPAMEPPPLALDMGVLDPDLLQLPADFSPASPSPSPSSSSHGATKPGALCKLHLEELFSQWISLPETQRLVSPCNPLYPWWGAFGSWVLNLAVDSRFSARFSRRMVD